MKVKVIQSSYDTMFEDMVNDFISKYKVDHIDSNINVIHNSLTYTAIIYYLESKPMIIEKVSTIEDLHFNNRILNVLRRNNVNTLDDLLNASIDGSLSRFRNLGKESLKEIQYKLSLI